MPIKKAAAKAWRQTRRKTVVNKKIKDSIFYLIKKTTKALEAKKLAEANDWAKKTVKAIDKAVGHGIVSKNTGARHKSRLIKKLGHSAKS